MPAGSLASAGVSPVAVAYSSLSAPIVRAEVPLAPGADEVEAVLGSFVVEGMTYAIQPDGTVILVAVGPDAPTEGASADATEPAAKGTHVPASALLAEDAGTQAGDAATVLQVPASVACDGTTYEVAAIGAHALALCAADEVAFPATIASIDEAALWPTQVQRIQVDEANPTYASFDGVLYGADPFRLLSIPGGRQGAVRIPDKAEEVEASAFSHCAGVDAVSVDAGGASLASWDGLLYDAPGSTLLRVPVGATDIAIYEGCSAVADDALEGCGPAVAAAVAARFPDSAVAQEVAASSVAGIADAEGAEGDLAESAAGDALAEDDEQGEACEHEPVAIVYQDVALADAEEPVAPVAASQGAATYAASYAFTLAASDGATLYKTNASGTTQTAVATPATIACSDASHVTNIQFIEKNSMAILALWHSSTKAYYFWVKPGYVLSGVKVTGADGTTETLTPSALSTTYKGTIKKQTRTVEPIWTAVTYSVTLNQQSGTGGTTSVNAKYGAAMPAITIPTRAGYAFLGYYSASNGSGTKYYDSAGKSAHAWDKYQSVPSTFTPTVTYGVLYAYWQPAITLHANGHPLQFKRNVWNDKAMTSATVTGWTSMTKDQTLTLPFERAYIWSGSTALVVDEPAALTTYGAWYNGFVSTQTGWTLKGWGAAATSTTVLTSGYVTTTAGLHLYAVTTANTYTVSFDGNGGTGGYAGKTGVTVTYDSAMPGTATAPTRAGYTFNGWFDAKTGGTKYYNANGSSARTWNKTANATLYAQWTANTYTVTLNQQSGTGGTTSVTATTGSAMPAITIPTRAGYAFRGYYTQTNGGGTQYYTWSGASARNWDIAANTTLYAKWTQVGVRVRVHVPNNSLWRYYAFDGVYRTAEPNEYQVSSWYPSAYFNSVRFYNGSVEVDGLAESGGVATGRQFGYMFGLNSNINGVSSAWMVTQQADGTYKGAALPNTSSWTNITTCKSVDIYLNNCVSYTVTWNANGGSVSPGSTTGVLPYATVPSAPLPTRAGYVFTGWFTKATDGDYACGSGAATPQISANTTYYAHWANQGPGVTMHSPSTINTYECYSSYSEADRVGPMSKPNPYGAGMWVNNIRLNGSTFQMWGGFTWKEGDGWIDAGITEQATGLTSVWVVTEAQDGTKTGFSLGSSWTSVVACKSVHVYFNDYVTYKVTWDPDGGTVSPTQTTGIRPYEPITNAPLPVRDGYGFRGWYAQRNGAGTQYTDWQPKGLISWDITGDATVYARWSKIGPPVTVHTAEDDTVWRDYAPDGKWSNDIKNWVTSVWTITDRHNFMQFYNGSFVVDGFRTSSGQLGRQFMFKVGVDEAVAGVGSVWVVATNADGTRTAFDLPSSEAWTEITDYVAVDAYFDGRDNSTITWDANGGEVSPEAFEGVRPYETVDPAPEPKRFGYKFDGWYTEAKGGERAFGAGDDLGQVTKSATYYAHWTLMTDVQVPLVIDTASFELGVPDGTIRVAADHEAKGVEGYLRSSMPMAVDLDSISCTLPDGAGAAGTDVEAFWAQHATYADVLLSAFPPKQDAEEGGEGAAGDADAGNGSEGDAGAGAGDGEADGGLGEPSAELTVSIEAPVVAADLPGGIIEGLTIPAATSSDNLTLTNMGEVKLLYGLSLDRLFADPADGGAGVDIVDLLPTADDAGFAVPANLLRVVFTVDMTKYA